MGWIKKASKSVEKTVKKVTKNVTKETGKFVKNAKDTWRDFEKGFDFIDGDAQREMKRLQKRKEQFEANEKNLNNKVDALQSYADGIQVKLQRLMAFHEIFTMALSNRASEYMEPRAEEIKQLEESLLKELEQLNADLEAFNKKYKNQLDIVTSDGWITKIIVSMVLIQGGIVRDIGKILSNDTDGSTWKDLGRSIAALAAVYAAVLLVIATAGKGIYFALAIIALVATAVLSFMTLDGLYGFGIGTGAIFGLLDFVINDILNGDEWISEKTHRLDSDHPDHAKMVATVQAILMITAVLSTLGATYGAYINTVPPSTSTAGANYGTAGKYSTIAGSEQTSILAGQDAAMGIVNQTEALGGLVQLGDTVATTSVLGLSLSDLAQAYDIAVSVYDYRKAREAYKEIQRQLEETKLSLEEDIQDTIDMRMVSHMKDSQYFLNDQQEHIDTYIWSMVSQSMYVDPYGTTPVANIRFVPDEDTRVMEFGFEDVFDESALAGSKGYFRSIIYGE